METPRRKPCRRTQGPNRHGYCKGGKPPPEYKIWSGLFQRCDNERCREYPAYGARGITVCDRWRGRDGFINFLADVGPQPFRRASLNRRNNDGPYSPENVAWADARAQQRNKRSNRLMTRGGVTMILADWALALGMKVSTLQQRVWKGWDDERALTEPVRPRRPYREWKRRNPNPKRPGRKPRPRGEGGSDAGTGRVAERAEGGQP